MAKLALLSVWII